MKNENGRDIEQWLRTVTLKSAGPGLRERILEAAQKTRQTTLLGPRLRIALAASALVFAFIFLTDAILSQKEKRLFFAHGDGTTIVNVRPNDKESLMAEILGGIPSGSRFYLKNYPSLSNRHFGALGIKRLREELIKEDFNGAEHTQDSF